MTLRVTISLPDNSPYEARITQTNNNPQVVLGSSDSCDFWIHSGNEIHIAEVPLGTKAQLAEGDFPLGKACDLSGEKTCDSCQ